MTATVSVEELVWTAAALPGLLFWARNLVDASRGLRVAKVITPRNGRYLWARFSVELTSTFMGIETLFVVIGVLSMLRPPAMGAQAQGRIVTVIGLIAASVVITVLAIRWKRVDDAIIAAARRRAERAAKRDGDS